ncbi:MAG: energy-coupling factor ABC transporter permease [Candidatus Omnitrophica bacterium]|nr:energy-coupling factor ABC transporter permease [Candidatus Omnitrophota bacterium]
MHIPDGFLKPNTFVPAWVVSVGILGYCLRKTKELLSDKMVPLMGVMAAFIFAAQMLNFPVLGGTSGHLLGGIFAAITLGPYAGALILSLVLIVQCLLFQDGGITALGANIFNMSIVGTIVSYWLYIILKNGIFKKSMLPAVFISSWGSVVLAATFCSLELALSKTAPIQIVLPAMVFVHMFIGIGEAVITVLVLSFILKVRPDLIYAGEIS